MTHSGNIGTQLLFENDTCRVWLLRLEPGGATDWHVHEYDYVYVVTAPAPVVGDYLGQESESQDDAIGTARYRVPDPGHRLRNMGATTYENIIVELKTAS